MGGTSFKLRPATEERAAVYEGPHGPMEYVRGGNGEETVLRLPDGEARLGWSYRSRDYDRLRTSGVPVSIAGREMSLRQDGKRLVLEGPDGVVGVARRRFLGRLSVEDASGDEVVRLKKLGGEVREGATAEQVALALLASGSGITVGPEDTGGPPLPF